MDQDMITDITLDHLPDLSEASISFQIPSNNASADLLLVDNTGGFDLLCNAVDDDISFAPVALRHPRGQPFTLGELTPRVQVTPHSPHRSRSSTPTQVPFSSAKPSVIQRPPTLGHRSPAKPRKTPSPVKSVRRQQLESPLVSSERFHQLRAEVDALGQEDESPSHTQIHLVDPGEDGAVECSTSSHANSRVRSDAVDTPPASEDLLAPIPEEKETHQDDEPQAVQDVVMTTSDSCQADATNVAVPMPPRKTKRNPRSTKPVSQQL